MGVRKLILPFHMVATQLKNLTPVGTATIIVVNMKNVFASLGSPTVNM